MCRTAGKSRWMTSIPRCQYENGCLAPLSEVKLTPIDSLILTLFTESPWIQYIPFGSSRAIKVSLDWSVTESLAKTYGIPWISFVRERLLICQNSILKGQDSWIESQNNKG